MTIPLRQSVYDAAVKRLTAKLPDPRQAQYAIEAYAEGFEVLPDDHPTFRPYVAPRPAPAPRETPRRAAPDESAVIARRTALRIAHPDLTLDKATATAVQQLLEEGEPVRLTMSEEAVLPGSVKGLYRAQFADEPEYNDEAPAAPNPQDWRASVDAMTDEEQAALAERLGLTDEDLSRKGGVDMNRVAANVAAKALRAAAEQAREVQVASLVAAGLSPDEAQATAISVESLEGVIRTRQAQPGELQQARDAVRGASRTQMGLPELDVEA